MGVVIFWHAEVVVFAMIPLIDVKTLATWAITLVVEAVVIVGAAGEAVVTCGHEVLLGTGITESGDRSRGRRLPRNPRVWRLRRPSVGPKMTTYGTL
jgi:hypothetical protein